MQKRTRAMETSVWDPAASLDSRRSGALYLEAALEDGDSAVIKAALESAARSPCLPLGERSLLAAVLEDGADIRQLRGASDRTSAYWARPIWRRRWPTPYEGPAWMMATRSVCLLGTGTNGGAETQNLERCRSWLF